jgi:cholesterol transport system auxiliary component
MRAAALLLAAAVLAGCAGQREGAAGSRFYDLGVEPPAARLPAVRVAAVRATGPFDGTEMYYRLGYRDSAELAAYTLARWAAPPAELLRTQVVRATADGRARCALEIELQEISQVFAAPKASEARLELVAVLRASEGPIGSRSVRLAESGAGAGAPEGVAAMRRAVGRAIAELAGWVGSVAECR